MECSEAPPSGKQCNSSRKMRKKYFAVAARIQFALTEQLMICQKPSEQFLLVENLLIKMHLTKLVLFPGARRWVDRRQADNNVYVTFESSICIMPKTYNTLVCISQTLSWRRFNRMRLKFYMAIWFWNSGINLAILIYPNAARNFQTVSSDFCCYSLSKLR